MDDRKIFPVNSGVKIQVKSGGDLYMQGCDRQEIGILYYVDNIKIQPEGDVLRVISPVDLDVMVPAQFEVEVERVGGDAYVRNLNNKLRIQKVGGDLSVQNAVNVTIERIGGDCQLQHITGSLNMERISGDLICQDIQCPVVIEPARGDVIMQSVVCGANVMASGDLTASLVCLDEGETNLRAKGDIELYLPKDAKAELQVESSGHDIRIKLAGDSYRVGERIYNLNIGGGGGTKIILKASGDVMVTDNEWSGNDVVQCFKELDEAWGNFERHNKSRYKFWQHQVEHSADIADRVAQQVHQRIGERAGRKMRARMGKMEVDFGDRFRNFDFDFSGFEPPVPPIPPVPPAPTFGQDFPFNPSVAQPPVTQPMAAQPSQGKTEEEGSKERMAILQMLSEKKITAEQAAELLKILSGKG